VLSGTIYSPDRIVHPPVPLHDVAMPVPPSSRASNRPADDELYDRGCDLVEAGAAIRSLAEDPDAGRALAALLGCIEVALRELGYAAASFDQVSGQAMPTNAMEDRMHPGFMNLGRALYDAELAATAARGLAGRSMAATRRGRSARDTNRTRPYNGLGDTHETSPGRRQAT
jgi:hypothetical protein